MKIKVNKRFVQAAWLLAALCILSASSALAEFNVVRGPYWPGETDYYYGNTQITTAATVNNSGSMIYNNSSLPSNNGTIEQGIYRSGDFYWGIGLLDWGADGATINNTGTIQGIVSGAGEAQGEGILSLQYLTVNNWGLIDGQVQNHDGSADGICGLGTPGITLYNHAGATISASAPYYADAVDVPNNVHIVNDGTITATAYAGTEQGTGNLYNSSGQAIVAGISTGGGNPGDTAYFENNGTISVYIPSTTATNFARAQAFTCWFNIPVVWKNTGTVSAQSSSPKGGAETFYYGAQSQPMSITNSGTISASGVSSTALWMENDGDTGDMSITNTGTISVSGPNPGFAILTAGWGPPNNIHVHYTNSGTISGGMLVLGFPATVYESGQIHTPSYGVGNGSDVHITGLPTIDPVIDGGGTNSTLDFNLTGTLELINGNPANGATSFSGLAGQGSIVVSGKTYRWQNFANGVSGRATPPAPVTGAVRFVARHSGKVLCPVNGQTENGTQMQQQTYFGGSEQQFIVIPDNGYYKIVGVQSGKAIEIAGGGTADGTKIQLADYNGQPWQKFSFIPTDSGYFEIVPSHATGSCLDVNGISTDDGAFVQLWGLWGGGNQQWSIQSIDPTPSSITSLSPTSVTGATTFTLTVNGSNFVPGAIIKWNGTNMATTYVSSTQLTASINKYYTTLSSYPGSAAITVLNPNGSRLTGGTLAITAPAPVLSITSLSPSSVPGAKTFTLTVNGNNFVSGSIIKFNGTNITTTYVSPTQLTASINKYYTTLASYPGSATISILNPDGARSSVATLTITAPLPAISSLSPPSITGATTFMLTVNGSNFVNGSIIKWNGTNMTTTYVSPTQLTASINKYYTTPTSYPGSAAVSVLNPDGGRSTVATIAITQPITPPAITSLSPSSVTGATTFLLTVNGTGFQSGAVIKWNGTNMTTTVVSSTQLTATINKYYDTLASYPGSATVSVLNPDGGRSSGTALTITSP